MYESRYCSWTVAVFMYIQFFLNKEILHTLCLTEMDYALRKKALRKACSTSRQIEY